MGCTIILTLPPQPVDQHMLQTRVMDYHLKNKQPGTASWRQ